VADITYIRLETEFVYLAVILDAFSRRVIGWALDRTLEATLAIQALDMALAERRPAADWSIIPIRASSMLRRTTPRYCANTARSSA
jgi:transposase InsO family protein